MNKWAIAVIALGGLAMGTANAILIRGGSGTSGGGGSHSISFGTLAGGTVGGSPVAGSGTYTGTAPSSISSATWGGGCSGSSTPSSFSAGSGSWSASFTVPGSAGTGCTITITDNLSDTATSPGVTISAASNSIAVTFVGAGCLVSSTCAISGTYSGTAPSGSGWTGTWNSACSGSSTIAISGTPSAGGWSGTATTPSGGCTGTLTVTDNLSDSATSSSATISTTSSLQLLTMENGFVTAGYTLGANGTFTGSAPSSMTATMSGCGGGTPAVSGLVTPSFGSGTYQIQVAMPTVSGTGCTITVTDNLSRTATSPAFNVAPSTSSTTITANIHNAPGWQASHAYTTTGNRTLNGAGWTPGSPGHYNPGSALNAYQLTSGSCTSASSGGPSGTGTGISDGTCTWNYVSPVDYITITGWNIDAPLWSSGRTYTWGETMTLNDSGVLRAYQLDGGTPDSTEHLVFCTSTVAPTGTGSTGGLWSTGTQTTVDGCVWDYLGDVTYSSRVATIPTQTYVNGSNNATAHLSDAYTASIWNDAEYVAGSGGERNPIASFNHGMSILGIERGVQGPIYTITLQAAPGESFRDTLTTSTPLAGYDQTKGVAIRNSNGAAGFPAAQFFYAGPAGLWAWDWNMVVNGLQIKSTAGPGIHAFNGDTITNNIIDGGWNNKGSNNADCIAVWMDNASVFVNNLVLSHGCGGIGAKYGNTFILWNTFVNVGSVSNPAALLYGWTWVFQDIAFANNAVSGYAHVAGSNHLSELSPLNARGVGNVTTVSGPDNTGTTWWVGGDTADTNASAVMAAPGTTFGVSAASMFVSPGSDYRPNTGLSSAGVVFGSFYKNCQPADGGCTHVNMNKDTPDILGNTRPNGGSAYSTGAEQHP